MATAEKDNSDQSATPFLAGGLGAAAGAGAATYATRPADTAPISDIIKQTRESFNGTPKTQEAFMEELKKVTDKEPVHKAAAQWHKTATELHGIEQELNKLNSTPARVGGFDEHVSWTRKIRPKVDYVPGKEPDIAAHFNESLNQEIYPDAQKYMRHAKREHKYKTNLESYLKDKTAGLTAPAGIEPERYAKFTPLHKLEIELASTTKSHLPAGELKQLEELMKSYHAISSEMLAKDGWSEKAINRFKEAEKLGLVEAYKIKGKAKFHARRKINYQDFSDSGKLVTNIIETAVKEGKYFKEIKPEIQSTLWENMKEDFQTLVHDRHQDAKIRHLNTLSKSVQDSLNAKEGELDKAVTLLRKFSNHRGAKIAGAGFAAGAVAYVAARMASAGDSHKEPAKAL